jgi:hypothetical protein
MRDGLLCIFVVRAAPVANCAVSGDGGADRGHERKPASNAPSLITEVTRFKSEGGAPDIPALPLFAVVEFFA